MTSLHKMLIFWTGWWASAAFHQLIGEKWAMAVLFICFSALYWLAHKHFEAKERSSP